MPDALLAIWFKLIGDGVLQGDWARVRWGALAIGVSATATWFLATVSTRVQRRFRDKVTIALESHVATLLASITTVAHHERPDYLDRLSVLRNQVFMLDHMYMSLFSTCGWILRLGVTIALLVSIHPALALLVLCALPPVYTSTWRPAVERAAYERGAEAGRLARHLFDVATTASPGKEVRVTGIADRLITERRLTWEFGTRRSPRLDGRPPAGTRWPGQSSAPGSWPPSCSSRRCPASRPATYCSRWPPGRVCRSTSARRLAKLASCAVSGWTPRGGSPGSRTTPRRSWPRPIRSSPSRLVRGIRFEDVSFAYPGTTRLVLEGVNLELPAGKVIAIVGENGAGKSTLVKLLAKMYVPTHGRIVVDDTDLGRIAAPDWRSRLAGAFQDFFRFEFQARHTVGVGDLPRLDNQPAVETAVGAGWRR